MLDHDNYPDSYIESILRGVKTIAVVGASDDEYRPVYGVSRFLQRKGYQIIPVNPRLAGQTLYGETVYATLADIPHKIDMVDIFRNRAELPGLFDQAMAVGARVIWSQLGLRDDAAARKAEQAGIQVVMNRCPAIEIPRLGL